MAKRTPMATISNITQFGDSLAKSLRRNLQWSKKLRNSVRLERAVSRDEKTSITIQVGVGTNERGEPLAGMAKAFEYGSGLHGEMGMYYQILPKNWPSLQFKGTNNFAGKIIRAKEVWHPGVEPKEYLQKSIDSTLAKSTDELKKNIRENIVDALNIEIREVNNANLR